VGRPIRPRPPISDPRTPAYSPPEARCRQRLERDQARRDDLRQIVVLRRTLPAELAAVEE
jgi:hypothetical protein